MNNTKNNLLDLQLIKTNYVEVKKSLYCGNIDIYYAGYSLTKALLIYLTDFCVNSDDLVELFNNLEESLKKQIIIFDFDIIDELKCLSTFNKKESVKLAASVDFIDIFTEILQKLL